MTYRSYKAAEHRREIWFLAGTLAAMLAIPATVVLAVMSAFGVVTWTWTAAAGAVVVITSRQMMAPALNRDGVGYGSRPAAKAVFRILGFRRF